MVQVGYSTELGGEPVRAVAARAEAAGLDQVSVGDHVSFRTGVGRDGLLAAAQYAAASDRLGVSTSVYLLPLRHPVLVARQLADIARDAPGRFTFGVGIGGEDRHEVEVCGVDPATRGRRMDECIALVRALGTGEEVDHDGEFFQVSRARVAPAPDPPVPVVVGGRSDAAIRRAGRLGDGWFGIWVSPERYAAALDEMRAHAEEAGRGDTAWTNALNVWCAVDDDRERARTVLAERMGALYGIPYERFERWSPAGTAEEVAAFLVPYVEAGCDIVNLITQATSWEAAVDATGEVRDHLLAAVGR